MPASVAPARVSNDIDIDVEKACDLLAKGKSHQATAHACGCTVRQLWRALMQTPQSRAAYAESKLARASASANRAKRISKKLEKKQIDPKSASVIINAEQWQARTHAPEEYGERQTMQHVGEQGALPPGTTVQVAIQQLLIANPQLLGVLRAAQQPVAAAAALPPAGADPMFACE